jgi:hypothetical protein
MNHPSIQYLVTDLPIPYRVRVDSSSVEMRHFVVPILSVCGSNEPPAVQPVSETRLKAAS